MASNQSQSISWNKKTKDGPFAPNESFPVEILPSIKNQIKRWSSAFSTVHPLRDTYTHTILICDFLSDGHLVLRCKKWFMRSTAVECECVCVCLAECRGWGGEVYSAIIHCCGSALKHDSRWPASDWKSHRATCSGSPLAELEKSYRWPGEMWL